MEQTNKWKYMTIHSIFQIPFSVDVLGRIHRIKTATVLCELPERYSSIQHQSGIKYSKGKVDALLGAYLPRI